MEPERVSISLAQLRAELGALELRLVDRLNEAIAHKADLGIVTAVEQLVYANVNRLIQLESTVVRHQEIDEEVADIKKQLGQLQSVAGYKKWLWAQTIALAAIAVAVFTALADHVGL
jgi:glutathione S-transferase